MASSYAMNTRQPNHPVPLAFVDFMPKLLKKGGMLSQPIYEPFPALMERANQWLRQHPHVYVKTCESVESRNDAGVDTIAGTYMEYQQGIYNRSLRIWISAKDSTRDVTVPQQIGYLNIVPECLESGGIFSEPSFEPFDLTLDKANRYLRNNPLPGRVLTVETQDTMFERWDGHYDPDATSWFERGGKNPIYYWLWIIRIFYEVGPPAHEIIGCADFLPGVLQEGSFFKPSCYEPLSQVGQTANRWIRQQRGIRVTNVQSVLYKAHSSWDGSKQSLDSMRTFYRERNRLNAFIRILRVCFARSHLYEGIDSSLLPNLNFRTFVAGCIRGPACLNPPNFEIQPEVMKRLQTWLGYVGCKVVSAETVRLRSYNNDWDSTGEITISWGEPRIQFIVYALRVFIDGPYREPPQGVLPPLPEMASGGSCCTIQ